MGIAQDRAHLVEALRATIDALCSPDLTLAQSRLLRPRVLGLLAALDPSFRSDRSPIPDRPPPPRSVG